MADDKVRLWLMRHGETEWSLSGAHTGRTDIPLTERGRENARRMGDLLKGRTFALVLTSPMVRARDTCTLAGYGHMAETEPDLREWDYGDYEGRSTVDIRRSRPGWELWKDGVINGESVQQVGARARRVIDRAAGVSGDVALFAHGHILRILASCWVGLSPDCGRHFALDTASVSVLGHERDTRVFSKWNRAIGD
jgi:broad specificity phosphatase PhoE